MRRPASPLAHVAVTDMPEDLRQLHAASVEVVGEAERIEVFAVHPDLYRWYRQDFYRKLFENSDGTMVLDIRWKELIRLKMSLSHGCFVCNSFNVPSALAPGFTQAQVDSVLDPTPDQFSAAELAVLELGDHLGLEQAADSEDLACLNGHMLVILLQGLFLPRAHGGQGTMSTRRCSPPQRGV